MQALVDPGEVAVKTQRRKIVDPEWGEHQDLDGDGTLDAELSLLAALLLGKTPQEIRQAEKTPGRGRVVELLQGGPVLDAEARFAETQGGERFLVASRQRFVTGEMLDGDAAHRPGDLADRARGFLSVSRPKPLHRNLEDLKSHHLFQSGDS